MKQFLKVLHLIKKKMTKKHEIYRLFHEFILKFNKFL